MDVVDTFRNTTPTVNRKLVQKSQIETSTCHRAADSTIQTGLCFYHNTLFHILLFYNSLFEIGKEYNAEKQTNTPPAVLHILDIDM